MQTDNESVAKSSTTFNHALAGLVELAAQVAKARGAILWIASDGPSGIVASTGLDLDGSDERLSVLGRDLADLDEKLDGGSLRSGFMDAEVAGQEILAGMPVAGPDGERLGSLWVLGRKGAAGQNGDTLESI